MLKGFSTFKSKPDQGNNVFMDVKVLHLGEPYSPTACMFYN